MNTRTMVSLSFRVGRRATGVGCLLVALVGAAAFAGAGCGDDDDDTGGGPAQGAGGGSGAAGAGGGGAGAGGGGAGGAGAGGGGAGGAAGAGGAGGVAQLYQAAVADAEVAEASEIVTTLVAIRTDNAALTFDAQGRVLVATWTSFAGYDDKVGQPTELGVDVFVTVAPEVKTFCAASGLSGEALSLRLEQKLGLPPGDGKDRMVELWAPTSALFRPSPDPEITDSVAELDFPAGTPQPHIDWVNALKAESYGQDGYPWTRLGYTYDWAPGAPSEVGLSEFVIAKGSSVVVNSVTATGDYCK